MSNTFTQELIQSLNAQTASSEAQNAALAQATLSNESMDAAAIQVSAVHADNLDNVLSQTTDLLLATESFADISFTEAQLNASRQVARIAGDPAAAAAGLAALTPLNTSGTTIEVSNEAMGVYDAIDAATLANESFEPEERRNALSFSVAYNLQAAIQDAHAEALFPVIAIDPTSTGIRVSTELTNLVSEVSHGVTGASARKKFNTKSLGKSVFDRTAWGRDVNAIVVARTADNANLLVDSQQTVDTSKGYDVTTAPIKFGKEVNLLSLSQDAVMLAKGIMSAEDVLDPAMKLENLYFDLAGDEFKFAVSSFNGANWTSTLQGSSREIQVAFDNANISFNTSTTTDTSGVVPAALTALPANHTVTFRVIVNGSGNVEHGNITAAVGLLEIDTIKDAAGNSLVSTNADYVTIAGVMGDLAGLGYDVDSFTTNSNLRATPQRITINTYATLYNVMLRSGSSVIVPVATPEGNATAVSQQAAITSLRMSLSATDELLKLESDLASAAANGSVADLAINGIGQHHVDPYFASVGIDLANAVDSESSGDREDDISAAITGTIKKHVAEAASTSKLITAHNLLNGNSSAKKIGVVVSLNTTLAAYVKSIDLGSQFDVKIVASTDPLIGDTIRVVFSDHSNASRNSVINPISLGFTAYAPTVITSAVRTVGGSTARQITNNPRFLTILNTAILLAFPVTNLDAVLGKVVGFRRDA